MVNSAAPSRSSEHGSAPSRLMVDSSATPEEVAAIVAAITALQVTVFEEPVDDTLHEWVHAARLRAHRAGLQRGPWRLSGRIGRRSRA